MELGDFLGVRLFDVLMEKDESFTTVIDLIMARFIEILSSFEMMSLIRVEVAPKSIIGMSSFFASF